MPNSSTATGTQNCTSVKMALASEGFTVKEYYMPRAGLTQCTHIRWSQSK